MTTGIPRRWASIAVIMLATVLLSACGGPPPATTWSALIVSDQTAYLAATDRIYVIDTNVRTPNSNRLLWSFPPADQNAAVTFHSQPALSEDGTLFAGSDSPSGQGVIFALDTSSQGQPVWGYPPSGDNQPKLGSIYGGIAYDGESVYAGSNDGSVVSLKAETGQPNWVFTATQRIWSSPVVSDLTVYVGSQDHNLYALNAANGSVKWTYTASAVIAGTPSVYGDTVYAGSLDNKLHAVNAQSGAQKWEFAAQGWIWDGPVMFDSTLYFGDLSGNFYALRLDGTPVWNQPLKLEGGIRAQPLVTEDTIYIATQARALYAIDRVSQAVKWTFTALHDGESLLTAPVLAGDSLLIAPLPSGGSPIRLYAVDAQSGNLQWQFPAPEVKP